MMSFASILVASTRDSLLASPAAEPVLTALPLPAAVRSRDPPSLSPPDPALLFLLGVAVISEHERGSWTVWQGCMNTCGGSGDYERGSRITS